MSIEYDVEYLIEGGNYVSEKRVADSITKLLFIIIETNKDVSNCGAVGHVLVKPLIRNEKRVLRLLYSHRIQ